MNSTNKPKHPINNYVKLRDIIFNATSKIRDNKTICDKDKRFHNNNYYITMAAGFNTLIATGYYQIAYINDVDMIKTDFDYTGSNTDVILDFNRDCLIKLIQTKPNQDLGSKQGRLI